MNYIEGIIAEIIFRNNENGYTVLDLAVNGELVTCVGNIPFLQPGEYVRFYGAKTIHKTFGEQFKVVGMEATSPTGDENIRMYLSSGIFKGIGEVLADRIVKKFHETTFDTIENCPSAIATVKGISMTLALKLAEDMKAQHAARDTVIKLEAMGFTLKQALKIYEAYGSAAEEIIKHNPYRLIDDIPGIGFEKADAIAVTLGVEQFSKLRIYSGIRHVLTLVMERGGHTCFPREQLKKQSAVMLDASEEMIESALDQLLIDGVLSENTYNNARAIALYSAYQAESYLAYRIATLADAEPEKQVQVRVINEVLGRDEMLSETQKNAILTAVSKSICIITGGPGTGKTTILNQLITILERSGLAVALAAPTGRAAKRMEKATMRKASTIHRLLEYGVTGEGDQACHFMRNEENPINADVVIIDETSMVDIYLMKSLLRAIAPGTRLILTGDADQLPSIGPGNVLRDLIQSEEVPVFRLSKVYRQTGNIAENAHKINADGEIDLFSVGDFIFLPEVSPKRTIEDVKNIFQNRLEEGVGIDEIQVICPIKRGEIGVYHFNEEIRELVNPRMMGKNELLFKETVFREGDKIMQTKNNYQKEWTIEDTFKLAGKGMGVFNGDIGMIKKINPREKTLYILFDGERLAEYAENELDQIEHAYAVTVHKSQGSEFDTVILPLYYGRTPFLTRNLLYTAITRAKSKLVMIGLENTVRFMVQNDKIMHRFTALNYEIKGYSAFFSHIGEGNCGIDEKYYAQNFDLDDDLLL